MKISVAKSTQTAIPELGREEKTLYYLVVENSTGKGQVLNVGEKTYKGVQELIAQEERMKDYEEKHAAPLAQELAAETPPVSKTQVLKAK